MEILLVSLATNTIYATFAKDASYKTREKVKRCDITSPPVVTAITSDIILYSLILIFTLHGQFHHGQLSIFIKMSYFHSPAQQALFVSLMTLYIAIRVVIRAFFSDADLLFLWWYFFLLLRYLFIIAAIVMINSIHYTLLTGHSPGHDWWIVIFPASGQYYAGLPRIAIGICKNRDCTRVLRQLLLPAWYVITFSFTFAILSQLLIYFQHMQVSASPSLRLPRLPSISQASLRRHISRWYQLYSFFGMIIGFDWLMPMSANTVHLRWRHIFWF